MEEVCKDGKELATLIARWVALDRAEGAEERRNKERVDTSTEQEFSVLAWLHSVKFLEQSWRRQT